MPISPLLAFSLALCIAAAVVTVNGVSEDANDNENTVNGNGEGQITIKLVNIVKHEPRLDEYTMRLTCLENMNSVQNAKGKYSADSKSVEFVFHTRRPSTSDNAGAAVMAPHCPRKEYTFEMLTRRIPWFGMLPMVDRHWTYRRIEDGEHVEMEYQRGYGLQMEKNQVVTINIDGKPVEKTEPKGGSALLIVQVKCAGANEFLRVSDDNWQKCYRDRDCSFAVVDLKPFENGYVLERKCKSGKYQIFVKIMPPFWTDKDYVFVRDIADGESVTVTLPAEKTLQENFMGMISSSKHQ